MHRVFILFAALTATFAGAASAAGATGTATIASPDGSSKSYPNVRITIFNESMAVTSADGQGTVVFGKASCTKVGELVRCLPWDATLFQNGSKLHIALQSGTVWLNPTNDYQSLADSSEKIAPHGVMLAVRTKRGTYVTLTGVVDEVHR
ncbi:MAG: hypothetical protein JO146_02085 [Candidatus Eremiobacteraeota bacterium]|nr:hypothetical protein [Candidatus Eremiobacteraeota bacterium]